MSYITVADLKRYLNIPFNDDDLLLADLEEAAEIAITNHLSRKSLSELADASTQDIPADLKTAIRSLVGTFYQNRESVAYAEPYPIPYTYQYLLQPYKNLDKSTY